MVIITYYESECLSNGSSEAQSAYTACKAAHQAFKWTSNSLWTLGIGGAGILLFVTILLLYLWRRKYSKPRSPPCQPSAEEVRKMKLLKRSSSRSFVSRASFRSQKTSSGTLRTPKNCSSTPTTTTSSCNSYAKTPTAKSAIMAAQINPSRKDIP